MSIKIYVPDKKGPIHVGTFTDQKAAEFFWNLVRENYKDHYGYKQPIYVDTKKGRKNELHY